MGEGRDSDFTVCSEHAADHEAVEAGTQMGESVVGVSESSEVGRDCDVGLEGGDVGDLGFGGPSGEGVGGEGEEVGCLEEEVAEEVKERVGEEKVEVEVKERFVKEKVNEEVKERVVDEEIADEAKGRVVEKKIAGEVEVRVVEEKYGDEVNERAVEEKVEDEVKERVVEDKVEDEVRERVVKEKVEDEVKERVVEEKVNEEVKERVVEEKVNEEVQERIVEEEIADEVKERVVEERYSYEVKERVVEEKVADEVKERILEEKVDNKVRETLVEEKVDDEVKETVVEDKVDNGVKEQEEEKVAKEEKENALEEKDAEELKAGVVEEVLELNGGGVDDVTLQDEGALDVEVGNKASADEFLGGIDQVGFTGEDGEVVRDVIVYSRKVDKEGEMGSPEMVGSNAAASVNDDKGKEPGTENGKNSVVDGASMVEGLKDMVEDGVEKSVERAQVDSKIDERDDLEANKVGASGIELQCHGPGIAYTETSVQPIGEHSQVAVDGKVVKVTGRHDPCSNVEEKSSALQKMDIDDQVTHVGQLSHEYIEKGSDGEQLKVATADVRDVSQSGDRIVSCPPSQVLGEAGGTLLHEKFISRPNVKALNPSCSGNGRISKAESDPGGITADSQMIDSGVSLMETDEPLDANPEISTSMEDQHLSSKECLDNLASGHNSQIDCSEQRMEIQQATENKQVGLGALEEIKANVGDDQGSASAVQPTHVVEGGVESGNNADVLTKFDVPTPVDADGSIKPNTKVLTKEIAVVEDGQQVLNSAISSPGSKEAEKQSELDVQLNSCVRHDTPSDLGKMEETVVEKQTNNAKQLSFSKGQGAVVGEAVDDASGLLRVQDMTDDDHTADTESHENIEEDDVRLVAIKPGSSVRVHQASYLLPPEDNEKLSVSNLVWGKVRSHPWWPGQIFDMSDSSEQAMKYYKKDCFLVAYFGDRTFAWNDASQLKPFQQHFSQIEKHSNSESFQNAVSCALEEISRRVMLGLACFCISKDDYEKIRFQKVENAGVRRESSIRDGEEKSLGVDFFEPSKLLRYTKTLARLPSGGADRLELEIAKAQLLSFQRLKGYRLLPELQLCGDLLESGEGHLDSQEDMQLDEENIGQKIPDTEDEKSSGIETEKRHRGSYHKRKHNLKEGVYHSKKQRNGSENETAGLQDDDSLSNGKVGKTTVSNPSRKRKASEPTADDSDMLDGRKTISIAKVPQSASPAPVPSFKIGNRICRVASQMATPPILKSNSERSQKPNGSINEPSRDDFDAVLQNSEEANGERAKTPGEFTSLDDLLLQLHLTAQDPFKEHRSMNIITSFFSDFRNSVITEQPMGNEEIGSRRKKSSFPVGDPETFEFEGEDVNDSYWTDRVIENGSEEEPSQRKKQRDHSIPVELAKSPQTNRRTQSKKRKSDGAFTVAAQKTIVHVPEKKQDLSPTELLMFFPSGASIPSEMNLNRTFRRFGTLWESETEIDQETNRARVIFKRCSDAEVAYNSAGRFNIFGPTSVNYQLSYTPSIPFKTSPPVTTEGQKDAV